MRRNIYLIGLLAIIVDIRFSSSFFFPWTEEHGNDKWNWDWYDSYNRIIRCDPSHPVQDPISIEEVQKLVLWAISKNVTVKPIGSLHSATDIICTEGLPIFMHEIKHMTYNPGDQTVTVGTGTELIELLHFLDKKGRALIQTPSFSGITVGGAIALGVHGSTLTHPTTISDQVIEMLIVDGTGTLHNITDPEELKAFRVNLGLLGILVEVKLQTVPQFKVQMNNFKISEEALFNGHLTQMARQVDFLQFWWLPSDASVVVALGRYVGVNETGNAVTNLIPNIPVWEAKVVSGLIEAAQGLRKRPWFELAEHFSQTSLYSLSFGKPPFYTEKDAPRTLVNPAVGFSYNMLSSYCTQCAWEAGKMSIIPNIFDFAFDVEELPDVVRIVKNVLKEAPAQFPLLSIYFRFGKASDSYMAVENGRITLHVEITVPARLDPFNTARMGLDATQAILQAWVDKLRGKPHWGKAGLYYLSRDAIERNFLQRSSFLKVMKKYDPNGLFMNDFGRRVVGISDKQTVNPQVKHCAIEDYCVCTKDSDCAPTQHCEDYKGYNVCRDPWTGPFATLMLYLNPFGELKTAGPYDDGKKQ